MPYLRLTPEALEVFNAWRGPLEHELRANVLHPALESHFAKYRKLVPSLALLHHLADRKSGAVAVSAIKTAIAWGSYARSHAERVYSAVTNADAATARALLGRIRKGDLQPEFSTRDVWRSGWAMLSDRTQVFAAIQLLVELDWLAETTRTGTGGRNATVYHVNPKALQA